MRDLILEVLAEGEREMLLAEAKVEVAKSLLAKYDEKQATEVGSVTVGEDEGVTEESETIDGDFVAV